jgi:hypothetical protein
MTEPTLSFPNNDPEKLKEFKELTTKVEAGTSGLMPGNIVQLHGGEPRRLPNV